MAIILGKQYDSNDPPEDDFPRCLRARRGNTWYNFGHWGHLAAVAGPPGTMKSTLLRNFCAAGLSGKECFQMTFDLGDRLIIWADGQQPPDIFADAQKQLLKLAGMDHCDRMIAMNYSEIPKPIDRLNDLYRLINKYRKDVGLLIMDTATDFVQDPNSYQESMELIGSLKLLGGRLGMTTLGVHHFTEKADKNAKQKMYGMLGTEWEKQASWMFYTAQQGKYFGWLKGKFRYKSFPDMWFTREGNHLIPQPYFPY